MQELRLCIKGDVFVALEALRLRDLKACRIKEASHGVAPGKVITYVIVDARNTWRVEQWLACRPPRLPGTRYEAGTLIQFNSING